MERISWLRLKFISNDKNNAKLKKKTIKTFSFYYHLFDLLPCDRNSGWFNRMIPKPFYSVKRFQPVFTSPSSQFDSIKFEWSKCWPKIFMKFRFFFLFLKIANFRQQIGLAVIVYCKRSNEREKKHQMTIFFFLTQLMCSSK